MKFILILLSILGLSSAAPTASECRSSLPFLEVCAYGGCFLNIAQHDMEYLNCDRKLRGKPPLHFYSVGKCQMTLVPKCNEYDF